LLVVSHDRDFLKELTDTVYEILPNRLKTWKGDVIDFLKEKKAESIAIYEQAQLVKKSAPSVGKDIKVSAKEDEREGKKRQQQLAKIESQIQALELKVKELEEAMNHLDYTDIAKVNQQVGLLDSKKRELDDKYQEWEVLSTS
jgi:ATP-binding cassette subfamily F protein 3